MPTVYNSILLARFYSAAALLAIQSAVLATAIASVRPSHARRMNVGLCGLISLWSSKYTPVFDTNIGWGDIPFHLKSCAQSDPPPSEKRRAIDEVRTLPPCHPKGSSKSEFVIFVSKNQFKSNKLCYEVSLCENFQWQSYSRTIPLSNGVYMLAVNVTLGPNI